MRVIEITTVTSTGRWRCTQCTAITTGEDEVNALTGAKGHASETGHSVSLEYASAVIISRGELPAALGDVEEGT